MTRPRTPDHVVTAIQTIAAWLSAESYADCVVMPSGGASFHQPPDIFQKAIDAYEFARQAAERAERAEAEAAALRNAVAHIRKEAHFAFSVVPNQETTDRAWQTIKDIIFQVTPNNTPGAALLAELHAARALVDFVVDWTQDDTEGAFEPLYEAYKAARATNSEEDTK